MVAEGFALLELCVCACLCEGETGRPEGPGQQSQAGHAETSSRGFKQGLHVIWMRPELPAEHSEDPGPVWI